MASSSFPCCPMIRECSSKKTQVWKNKSSNQGKAVVESTTLTGYRYAQPRPNLPILARGPFVGLGGISKMKIVQNEEDWLISK